MAARPDQGASHVQTIRMISQECESHAYINRKPWLRCLLFIMRTCGERTREGVSSPLCRSPYGKRQMAERPRGGVHAAACGRSAAGPESAGHWATLAQSLFGGVPCSNQLCYRYLRSAPESPGHRFG